MILLQTMQDMETRKIKTPTTNLTKVSQGFKE